MSVKLRRRKSFWVATVVGVVALLDIGLLWSNNRLLFSSTLIPPGYHMFVSGHGDIDSGKRSARVCRYFSGMSTKSIVAISDKPFAPGCNWFLSRTTDQWESGTIADWVSGAGSLLAVIAALYGYFLIEKQRRSDAKDITQGHIYQIGFKLSTVASEVHTALSDLNSQKLPIEELLAEKEPLWIVGGQGPASGYERSMVRDLTDEQQNLLMLVREEEFLMEFSEIVARHEAVRLGFVEYSKRRDMILAMLPDPEKWNGQIGTFGLTTTQVNAIMPHLYPTAMLMVQARQLAKINVDAVMKLCDRFKPMMDGHFPDMHVHSVGVVATTSNPVAAGGDGEAAA